MKYLREVKVALGVIIITCSIAGGFILSAKAGDLREFVLCEHKTGRTTAHLTIDGIVITGIWKIKPETVVEVVPIEGDKCTMVVTNKSQASVVGSAAEVECRLLGGDGCAARKQGKQ